MRALTLGAVFYAAFCLWPSPAHDDDDDVPTPESVQEPESVVAARGTVR